MNAFKAFFTRITQCCTDISSYKNLRNAKVSTGMWYLYRLFFLTSLVVTLWLGVALIHSLPQIRAVVQDVESKIPALYPKELVMKVQSGSLTTNVKEPYTIRLPKEWEHMGNAEGSGTYVLAVINTKASPEDYDKQKTLLFFTKKSVTVAKQNGDVRLVPYDKFQPTFTVTQKSYQTFVTHWIGVANSFIPALKGFVIGIFIIAPFIGALFGMIGWMIALLLWSLVLLFLAYIAKWQVTFGQIYRLGLFAATPVIILGMLLWLVGLSFPLLLRLFFLVWMMVILQRTSDKKTVA